MDAKRETPINKRTVFFTRSAGSETVICVVPIQEEEHEKTADFGYGSDRNTAGTDPAEAFKLDAVSEVVVNASATQKVVDGLAELA